jgi:hypothetical protein
MSHTPYGYRIVDGRAVIDEEQAANVQAIFMDYLNGTALMVAAAKVGLKMYHGSVGRLLRNCRYLGDDFYPSIIDQKTFDAVQEKRMERAKRLRRVHEFEETPKPECSTQFYHPKIIKKFDDPFEQAEYAYSLIESEVEANDSN